MLQGTTDLYFLWSRLLIRCTFDLIHIRLGKRGGFPVKLVVLLVAFNFWDIEKIIFTLNL